MLDAAHEQNMAFIRLSVFREAEYDSLCRANMTRLEQTLSVAQLEAVDKTFLDSLAFATTELRLLTDRFRRISTSSGRGSPPWRRWSIRSR